MTGMRYREHNSETGSFQELARKSDVEFGQLSILTVAPMRQRGGHYHKRKREWFCCIRGECYIVLNNPEGKQMRSLTLDEGNREFVVVEPYEVHTVMNLSDKACELLVISSEEYDPDDTDTYRPNE